MAENRLAREKSPYLLQHKNNPVDWYPWGREAFEKAERENKPVFLSIGYSTCHWCHVMEKDSFERQDVAALLNRDFVSIKVDREERPDVDSLYMSAVQAMTGSGGWPMSVLLTPDGKPFWGGTFVARAQFTALLERVAEVWKDSPEQIIESGERLADFLRHHSDLPASEGALIDTSPLVHFFNTFKERFDPVHGGLKGAPKFPSALALMALLRFHRRTANPEALAMAEKTLKEMRRGGVYDQVGGGFHRYSVDERWLIPHFEKMLYDNALLATAAIELFQVTGNGEFARTAREIFDYVLRDMTAPSGAFYSAEDADSEGIEGQFYVWSEETLWRVLPRDEFEKAKLMFHVTAQGNFHAHKTGDEVTEKRHGPPAITGNVFYLSSDSELPDPKILGTLLKIRGQRIRPHLDDKILTAWNGLMISALAKGFQVLNEPTFLEAAGRAADFVLKQMVDENGDLQRCSRDGRSGPRAQADDHACLIQACLDLYESDFDPKWFSASRDLQAKMDAKFWDKTSGSYFDSDGSDALLVARSKTYEDTVVPSANSVACLNLLRLFSLTGSFGFREKAEAVLKAAGYFVRNHPSAVTKLLQSLDRLTDASPELAVAGDFESAAARDFLKKLRRKFLPNLTIAFTREPGGKSIPLLAGREPADGRLTFYICEGMTCKMPIHNEEGALLELARSRPCFGSGPMTP